MKWQRTSIGFKEEYTGVVIYDGTGVHYSSYVDENGKEIITR